MINILIVEDELIPANYLKRVLQLEGYNVFGVVDNGKDAISIAKEKKPDIILMDIMLKGALSGCDSAIAIRQILPHVTIIFLSAYSDNEMIEQALDSKAYAYLIKPYKEKEIIATLKLAIRHREAPTVSSAYTPDHIDLKHGYSFNPTLKRLFLHGTEIELGPVAIQLIALLCSHPNISISSEHIMQQIWKEEMPQQTLRSLIHRIREATYKDIIININKVGYKINL